MSLDPNVLQLGAIVSIVLALFKFLEFFLNKFSNGKSAKTQEEIKTQNDVDIEILKVRFDELMNNHLKHIQDSLTEMGKEQKEMRELQIRIAQKIGVEH